jgi:hypothetical protein
MAAANGSSATGGSQAPMRDWLRLISPAPAAYAPLQRTAAPADLERFREASELARRS